MEDCQENSTRPRYVTDEKVFPAGVVDALRRAVGGVRRVITFRADPKKGPTSSENDLPPALVMVCRRLLTEGKHLRTVHVRGTHNVGKPPNPNQNEAKTLVALGFSAQSVADAIGVHRVTIARWAKASEKRQNLEKTSDSDYENGIRLIVRNLRDQGEINGEQPTIDQICNVLGLDSESKLRRRAQWAFQAQTALMRLNGGVL